MRETRSPSQVLFSLLPQQTVDIGGRIWRVDEWVHPVTIPVDVEGLRNRLIAAVDPWRKNNTDENLTRLLYSGSSVEAVGVNKSQGVKVSLWPNNWVCRRCRRISKRRQRCRCGIDDWGQLHFVAFHDCGYSDEPWIAPCREHNELVVNSPQSSSVRDLIFSCPICKTILARGFGGGRPCRACQQPGLNFNVHRAASVYTPHSLTMINPARPEHLRELLLNGGRAKCLHWVLAGMPTPRPQALPPTRRSLIESLMAQGLSESVANAAADEAERAGELTSGGGEPPLPAEVAEDAEASALEVALATYEGRRSGRKLAEEPVSEELGKLYRSDYQSAIASAGLRDVDHVDRFPILRGVFGFSRGGGSAGEKRLVSFRGKDSTIRVYADANETEAFYLSLDPVKVAQWLKGRGLIAYAPNQPRDARVAILKQISIPARGDEIAVETAGSAVLTLVHSYTHRLIRQLAVLAGVDRESLAEYLVPHHLGAFVYATPRGEFVLGGLQSVFETDLHRLLEQQVDAESRCPLDPGCDRSSGACLACLHIGEPSCTHYNRFLDRKTLFGDLGFFSKDLRE